ncbi:MAG: hypothetical protein H0X62_12635 [Bacteroidetes bacterium]|nr:hypothetical protein [Bacteroidota bacterium]
MWISVFATRHEINQTKPTSTLDSHYKPINLLKGNSGMKGKDGNVRKGLVILQFTISAALIAGTIIVFMQMNFMRNKNLGFDKEQVLVIKVPDADTSFVGKLAEVKHELIQNPKVLKVSSTHAVPGKSFGTLFHYITHKGEREDQMINFMAVDEQYIDFLDIPLHEGRFFDSEITTDQASAFVVNQAAVKAFGWDNLDEVELSSGLNYKGKIIGVVKDFHYTSLHKPIEPLVINLSKDKFNMLLVKLQAGDLNNTISFVENTWKNYSTRYPMEYFFLDDNFNSLYQKEEKMLVIFGFFSLLTIIIACLGLYGLAAYAVEIRSREIGIRKVVGGRAKRHSFFNQ